MPKVQAPQKKRAIQHLLAGIMLIVFAVTSIVLTYKIAEDSRHIMEHQVRQHLPMRL